MMEVTLNPVIAMVGAGVLGWMWQWVRAPKKIPNWVGYAVFSATAVGLVFWAVPDFEELIVQNWRSALITAVLVLQSIRGSAAAAKDAKAAPPTNSL